MNASALYLAQGAGAGIGALILMYVVHSVFGRTAGPCALPGFAFLLLPTSAKTELPSMLDSPGR